MAQNLLQSGVASAAAKTIVGTRRQALEGGEVGRVVRHNSAPATARAGVGSALEVDGVGFFSNNLEGNVAGLAALAGLRPGVDGAGARGAGAGRDVGVGALRMLLLGARLEDVVVAKRA